MGSSVQCNRLDSFAPPPSLLLPLPMSLLYTHSLMFQRRAGRRAQDPTWSSGTPERSRKCSSPTEARIFERNAERSSGFSA
jgi:hypothetical protein